MNQLWKREKNLWWCLCTQQSFNLSGGGTVRRMTVGGFIVFIYILIMCIHLKNNLYCIFSRSAFWINSGDEFLNKFLCWYFIIIMVVLNRACLIWLRISGICEHSSTSFFICLVNQMRDFL